VAAFVRVVEEGSAVTLIPVAQAHELHTADILAEVKAQLWGHWHPILLGNFVFVPKLLLSLCVVHTAHWPHARWTSHWINRIRRWKAQLSELWHCPDKACLKSNTLHSQILSAEAICDRIRRTLRQDHLMGVLMNGT
jgi:hypothetical protein